jgi:hypothetical protein
MGPFPNKNRQVTINLGVSLDFRYVLSHQTLIFRVKEQHGISAQNLDSDNVLFLKVFHT